MSNRVEYGFRWNQAANGGHPLPSPIALPVASEQAFNIAGGGQGVYIQSGDVMRYVTGTGLQLCVGDEDTAARPTHIVIGVAPYWDSINEVMEPTRRLPSGVNYGALLQRQSFLHVVPVEAGRWEVDVNDNVTATTLAAYQALIGRRVNHINSGQVNAGEVAPLLNISGHDAGDARQWEIVNVSNVMSNMNFDQERVKLIVEFHRGTSL